MPPLPPVPNVLQVIIRGNTSETTPITWENKLHFEYSGTPPSNSTAATIAAQVSGEWGTHMAPECPSSTVLNFVQVIDLTSSTSGSGANFDVHVGSRGDDEIPANAAVLAVYPIQRRYRGGHPRSYLLVGGNADFLDAAHWSTLFYAEVQTHWHAFLASIVGYSTGGTTISNMCSVSYYSGTDPVTHKPIRRVSPVVDTIDISTMYTVQQMASQRRRIGRSRR